MGLLRSEREYTVSLLLCVLVGFQCIVMTCSDMAAQPVQAEDERPPYVTLHPGVSPPQQLVLPPITGNRGLGAIIDEIEMKAVLANLGPEPSAEDIGVLPSLFQIPARTPIKDQGSVGSCVGNAASSVMDWWRCGLRCYRGTGNSALYTCTCPKDSQGACPCVNPLFSRQYLYDRSRVLGGFSCKDKSACNVFGCPHDRNQCATGSTSDCSQTVTGHDDGNCPCGGAYTSDAANVATLGVCSGDSWSMQTTYCQSQGENCDKYVYPVNSPYGYGGCSSAGTVACQTAGACGGMPCAKKYKASNYFSSNTISGIKNAIYTHGFFLAEAKICSCWWSSTRPWGSGCLGSYCGGTQGSCVAGCYTGFHGSEQLGNRLWELAYRARLDKLLSRHQPLSNAKQIPDGILSDFRQTYLWQTQTSHLQHGQRVGVLDQRRKIPHLLGRRTRRQGRVHHRALWDAIPRCDRRIMRHKQGWNRVYAAHMGRQGKSTLYECKRKNGGFHLGHRQQR